MKIRFLGTGTSIGVPELGCTCEVCTSTDIHDKRMRCSALVTIGDVHILIDCGPDFRTQMMQIPYVNIDAVFVTHEHYDHLGGVDDLRPFCREHGIDIYAEQMVVNHLYERIPYCFGKNKYPGSPQLELKVIKPGDIIDIKGVKVEAFRVMHGNLPILAFRIGRFAYITDMLTMPEDSKEYIKDVDLLVVNALRTTPHPTHQSISEAIGLVRSIGSPYTYLTHFSHGAGLHSKSSELLPPNMQFAYDGLEVEF